MTQNALLHPQRLSHRLSFSLFFSLSLRDWGVSCNLRVGFSLSCTNTCSVISVSFSSGNFIPISSLGRSPGSALFSQFLLPGLRLSAGFPARIYLRVCSMFVTGQLCRKEGRLMTTEICSDSGPVQTVPMGSMCFLASVECQRTPIQRLGPSSQTHAPHSGKGSSQ